MASAGRYRRKKSSTTKLEVLVGEANKYEDVLHGDNVSVSKQTAVKWSVDENKEIKKEIGK